MGGLTPAQVFRDSQPARRSVVAHLESKPLEDLHANRFLYLARARVDGLVPLGAEEVWILFGESACLLPVIRDDLDREIACVFRRCPLTPADEGAEREHGELVLGHLDDLENGHALGHADETVALLRWHPSRRLSLTIAADDASSSAACLHCLKPLPFVGTRRTRGVVVRRMRQPTLTMMMFGAMIVTTGTMRGRSKNRMHRRRKTIRAAPSSAQDGGAR
jgi:hypothetical protein